VRLVGGTVPDDLVVQINPTRVAMIGTDQKPARCCSLEGEVGKGTHCTIYEQRSSVCREFDASWSHGVQNTDCDAARAAFGLAPLEHRLSSWTCPSALSRQQGRDVGPGELPASAIMNISAARSSAHLPARAIR